MHKWLSTTSIVLHNPDIIADEDAVDHTQKDHQFGSAVTESPFFPGTSSYSSFRGTASTALDANQNATTRQAARLKVVSWLTQTRSHLESLLVDPGVGQVRIGDGSTCANSYSDGLPEEWMKSLLLHGKI